MGMGEESKEAKGVLAPLPWFCQKPQVALVAVPYPSSELGFSLSPPPAASPSLAWGGKHFSSGVIILCWSLTPAHTSANSLLIKSLLVKPWVMCPQFPAGPLTAPVTLETV